jgi:pentatricopeptide repeat protein
MVRPLAAGLVAAYHRVRPRPCTQFCTQFFQAAPPNRYRSYSANAAISQNAEQPSGYNENNRWTAKHQQKAVHFLNQVQQQRIASGIVAQKTEEIYLQMITTDPLPQDGPLALELLQIALAHAQQPTLIPRLFSLACQIMMRSGHPLAAKEVRRAFGVLIENHKKYFTNNLASNTHNVNDAFCQLIVPVVLDANRHKAKLDYDTRQQLDQAVSRMQQLWDDPIIRIVASAEAYNAVIVYLCKQQKAKEAYQLLKRMVTIADSGNYPVPMIPPLPSFTMVISTFGKLGDVDHATEILSWMLENQDTSIPPPNSTCFNGLLDAWAKGGRKDAGTRAEQVLEWMQQLHDTQGLDTRPTEYSYNICINAWARTPGPQSPVHAEAILRRMIDLHESGSEIGPSEPAFTSVMNAWANSERNDAPERVAAILHVMEGMAVTNNSSSVNAIPYTILIKAWGRLASRSAPRKKQECADKILGVISHMEERGTTPTAPTHNAIIVALHDVWSTHGLFYFLELEEKFRDGLVEMNTRTFNCGLNAIATMNKPDQAEQAMTVLQRMYQYAEKNKNVRPDETTFNIILKVLSKSRSKDAALKANQLLLEMDDMPAVKPTYISYLTCIMAWGRSDDPEKFVNVQRLLSHFQETHRKRRLGGTLTVSPFNAALSVCAYNNGMPELNSEALSTALGIMEELRKLKSVRPNQITYASLFQAIGRMAEPGERDALMARQFEHCISDGLVSRELLKTLHGFSPSTLSQFFGDDKGPQNAVIPKDWSKNFDDRTREPDHSSGVFP